MKKIILLSDTHSHLDEAVFKYLDDCDEIWHAGDIGSPGVAQQLTKRKPLRAVFGNIDDTATRAMFPEDLLFETEGMKTLMTHIAGSPGKYHPRVRQLLKEQRPALLICGHSHILKVMFDKTYDVMYLNPGAAGNEGFHKVKTMLRFEIADGKLQRLEAIELGKRGALK